MEYKINNFNLSDIHFTDLKSLAEYFDISIPKQRINNILLGPNVLNLSNIANVKNKKTPEDKKILSSLSRLIITSQNQKPEQCVLTTTNSFTCTKVFLKRILKQLGLISIGGNERGKADQVINDIKFNMSLLDLISYFTCIKDEDNDDIPITDYDFTFVNDSSTGVNGAKLMNVNFRLFNYEMITMKTELKSQLMNICNINFLYMLLYNVPLKDLFKYLYCNTTKEYFGIFDEEIELQDYVRRYVLINQLKLTKTESQYEVFAKENENYIKIQKEYDYYKQLYLQYQKIKTELMFPEQLEQKLIGMFFGMILLAEFDIMEDPLYATINRELKTSYSNSSIDLFTFIRNIVFNDDRFKYIQTKDQNNSRIESKSILSKIALNTTISEERILYLLITDLVKKGKGTINQSKESITFNCHQFILILYQISIDRIKFYIDNVLKGKKSTSPQTHKIQFIVSRSNLIFENSFKQYCFKNNPFYSISSSDMRQFDDKTYIISQNVKEHIVSNYLQELKNFIYLNHALGISSNTKEYNWPKVDCNDEFISKLLNDNFNYESIINLYENPTCGLIRIVIDMSFDDTNSLNKEEMSLNVFKANFEQLGKRKNVVQLTEVFNTETQGYQTFIQVKHSFGTFLYDINAMFSNKKRIASIKEQTIYKFLDYKPSYVENYFRYNEDMSYKLLKKLSSHNLFICNVIQFSTEDQTMAILDDFKLNNIYYFYSNYFNYIINIKEIRESIIKSKSLQLTHSMIRDDYILFKFLCKKLRFSVVDYCYYNGYVFARSKLSRAMDNNKNISSIIFKHNPQLFNFLLVKKLTSSKFNYFVFIVNCVKTFVKLTKIYNEKKVLSNVRNLLTDVIVDNYEILDNENKKLKHNVELPCNINQINQNFLPKIDQLHELVFDFNKEALGKILPKLRSNLTKLKRVWRDYVSDIKYLELNKHIFNNQKSTQLVIEQRLVNFQILLFLFSKKYKFINSESVMKYGVLLTEFTKTVSSEVLALLTELDKEFHSFLNDNDLNIIENTDSTKLESLIARRIELQKASRLQCQLTKELYTNKQIGDSSIGHNKRNEKNEINYDDAFNRAMINIQNNQNGDNFEIKSNLSFKDLKYQNNSKEDCNESQDNKDNYRQLIDQKTSSELEMERDREREGHDYNYQLKIQKGNNEVLSQKNNPKGRLNKFMIDLGNNKQFMNPILCNESNPESIQSKSKEFEDSRQRDLASNCVNNETAEFIEKKDVQYDKKNIIVDFREELIIANIQKAEEERIGRNKLKAEEEKRSEAIITGSDSLSQISGYSDKNKTHSPIITLNINAYNPKNKIQNYKKINEENEENQEIPDQNPSNLNINKIIGNKLKTTKPNQNKVINQDPFPKLESNDSNQSQEGNKFHHDDKGKFLDSMKDSNRDKESSNMGKDGGRESSHSDNILKNVQSNVGNQPKDEKGISGKQDEMIKSHESKGEDHKKCNHNHNKPLDDANLFKNDKIKDANTGELYIDQRSKDKGDSKNSANEESGRGNVESNKNKSKENEYPSSQDEEFKNDESKKGTQGQEAFKNQTPKKEIQKSESERKEISESERKQKSDKGTSKEQLSKGDTAREDVSKQKSSKREYSKRKSSMSEESEGKRYNYSEGEQEEGEYEDNNDEQMGCDNEEEEMEYSPEKEDDFEQNVENYEHDEEEDDNGDVIPSSQKTCELGTEEKLLIMHSYTNPYMDSDYKQSPEYPTYNPDTQMISSIPLQIPLSNIQINKIIESLHKKKDNVIQKEIIPINHPSDPKKSKQPEAKPKCNPEEQKQISLQPQTFQLPALKELDDKINQLKKELNALEIMGSITEKTSLLCFKNNEYRDDQVLIEEAEKIDKEFYDDIEEKLKIAENTIRSQFP